MVNPVHIHLNHTVLFKVNTCEARVIGAQPGMGNIVTKGKLVFFEVEDYMLEHVDKATMCNDSNSII